MNNAINPDYYKLTDGIQVIDITEDLTCCGAQAVQYLARSYRVDGQVKNPDKVSEDTEKALWFCTREMARLGRIHLHPNITAPWYVRGTMIDPLTVFSGFVPDHIATIMGNIMLSTRTTAGYWFSPMDSIPLEKAIEELKAITHQQQ